MPIFRKGTEADIKQIAELEAKIFSDAWTEKSVMETFEQTQAFITVAEVDGRLAGYCIIYYVMDEAEIARIAIGEDVRRQGIGKGLLDYTCECCKERQIERLLLDVREGNEGARAFYQKYGFQTDGIRKNFYDLPKENAVLMSRILA
ncbi:MAG: ribosomal protein S18-alanine N-acetyltransferase [Tyzzerella sp.]|nr:ribosomal protein S18-alanine N-acetyltransferase [Tyzzerella sp.]